MSTIRREDVVFVRGRNGGGVGCGESAAVSQFDLSNSGFKTEFHEPFSADAPFLSNSFTFYRISR